MLTGNHFLVQCPRQASSPGVIKRTAGKLLILVRVQVCWQPGTRGKIQTRMAALTAYHSVPWQMMDHFTEEYYQFCLWKLFISFTNIAITSLSTEQWYRSSFHSEPCQLCTLEFKALWILLFKASFVETTGGVIEKQCQGKVRCKNGLGFSIIHWYQWGEMEEISMPDLLQASTENTDRTGTLWYGNTPFVHYVHDIAFLKVHLWVCFSFTLWEYTKHLWLIMNEWLFWTCCFRMRYSSDLSSWWIFGSFQANQEQNFP